MTVTVDQLEHRLARDLGAAWLQSHPAGVSVTPQEVLDHVRLISDEIDRIQGILDRTADKVAERFAEQLDDPRLQMPDFAAGEVLDQQARLSQFRSRLQTLIRLTEDCFRTVAIVDEHGSDDERAAKVVSQFEELAAFARKVVEQEGLAPTRG